MRRYLPAILFICLLSAPAAAGPHRTEQDFPRRISDRETLRETIPAQDARGLMVDNFHGSISIVGHDGSDIRVTARRTIRAGSAADLDRAMGEVSLKIDRAGKWILVCVDGPFKDPWDCIEWNQRNRHDESRYRVTYDFEIEVPRSLKYELSTIHGDLVVSGMRDDFAAHTVEGTIDITDAAGSGHAQSVNGPVRVTFAENPTRASEFGTVNGEVEVSFRDDLSADLVFDTMNGEILSDFDYTPLPLTATTIGGRSRGDAMFRLEVNSGIRISGGGPRLRFSNINGNILIRKSR